MATGKNDSDWALFEPKSLALLYTGTFGDCQSVRRQGSINSVIRTKFAYGELVATRDRERAIADAPGVMLAALREAEAFITGFEDDDVQDVSALLTQVRAAIKAGEA